MNNHYRLYVLIAGVFVIFWLANEIPSQGNICHFHSIPNICTHP
nr:MAG TPA: Protein of unknown function (DUF3634) [Caudoviricetes sp.]